MPRGAGARPAGWHGGLALCVALSAGLALGGCAAKEAKPTSASAHVEAVSQVLATMAEGLESRDVTALASQWDPSVREAARARIEAGLNADAAAKGRVDVRLMPISVRAEGGRRVARVAWEGTWGGRPVRGGFEMVLTADEPPAAPAILAIRGEDPAAGPPAGMAGNSGTLGPATP